MRKPVTPVKSTTPKVYPVAYVNPATLKGAEYNPRTIEDKELQQLAHNIAQFGFLDAVSACKEDNELLGGHQRVKAALMLLEGKYKPLDSKGKPLAFTPPTTIPVIYVEGLTGTQRRTINLSLNRISGTWDEDKLASVVKDLHASAMAQLDATLEGVEAELQAIELLTPTGFTAAEIANYLDVSTTEGDGKGPLPTKGTPKLTLEFTSKELRDAFKAYVGEGDADVPSGDNIAKRLGITITPAKRKSNQTAIRIAAETPWRGSF